MTQGGATPQIIVSLLPDGRLAAELPGPNGARRKVELRPGEVEETLVRVLQAQAFRASAGLAALIGEPGAPTQALSEHWANHQVFPSQTCAFCRELARLAQAPKRRRSKATPIVLAEHGGVVIRRLQAKSPKIKGNSTSASAEELGL